MSEPVEVYLRHSGDRNLLMFHVQEALKERLLQQLAVGEFAGETGGIRLDMPAPAVGDEDAASIGMPIHAITVNYF